MIPALAPSLKEQGFGKKSLRNREKTFSRFLRGILRSKELSTHPFVLEFLKIDHAQMDRVRGMKDFSKRLTQLEQELFKNKDKNNNFYKISSTTKKIPMTAEFVESNLQAFIDKEKGKQSKDNYINQNKFDEKQYVASYEQLVGKILAEAQKFTQQAH